VAGHATANSQYQFSSILLYRRRSLIAGEVVSATDHRVKSTYHSFFWFDRAYWSRRSI